MDTIQTNNMENIIKLGKNLYVNYDVINFIDNNKTDVYFNDKNIGKYTININGESSIIFDDENDTIFFEQYNKPCLITLENNKLIFNYKYEKTIN